MLTVCMLFHCLDNLVAGSILSQQAFIVAGNDGSLVCNNNRSILLSAIAI